jgi:hypothetical protein
MEVGMKKHLAILITAISTLGSDTNITRSATIETNLSHKQFPYVAVVQNASGIMWVDGTNILYLSFTTNVTKGVTNRLLQIQLEDRTVEVVLEKTR